MLRHEFKLGTYFYHCYTNALEAACCYSHNNSDRSLLPRFPVFACSSSYLNVYQQSAVVLHHMIFTVVLSHFPDQMQRLSLFILSFAEKYFKNVPLENLIVKYLLKATEA